MYFIYTRETLAFNELTLDKTIIKKKKEKRGGRLMINYLTKRKSFFLNRKGTTFASIYFVFQQKRKIST